MELVALFALLVGGFATLSKLFKNDDPSTPKDETGQPVENVPEVIAPDVVGAVLGPVAGLATSAVQAVTDAAETVIAGVFGTKYDQTIIDAAVKYGIPPRTLYNLLYAESRFRPDIIEGLVTSSVGAIGIAQFMPATAIEELGSIEAAKDPYIAIPGAARYLAKLIKSTGSIDAGVAAYNWGIGNVKRKGLASAPKETVNYVSAITGSDISKG